MKRKDRVLLTQKEYQIRMMLFQQEIDRLKKEQLKSLEIIKSKFGSIDEIKREISKKEKAIKKLKKEIDRLERKILSVNLDFEDSKREENAISDNYYRSPEDGTSQSLTFQEYELEHNKIPQRIDTLRTKRINLFGMKDAKCQEKRVLEGEIKGQKKEIADIKGKIARENDILKSKTSDMKSIAYEMDILNAEYLRPKKTYVPRLVYEKEKEK